MIRQVVDAQSARYNAFITNFAAGFQTTRLEMYKWLLYPILIARSDELERGLRYNHVNCLLEEHHPEGSNFNPGNLTQALQSTAPLQAHLNIKPFILDYDQTNRRLNVVDRGFLVWLEHQDRQELLESLGLPTETAETGV